MKLSQAIYLLLMITLFIGCADESVNTEEPIVIETDRFRFSNDASDIESRFTEVSIPVEIDTIAGRSLKKSISYLPPDFSLEQVSELEPPIVNEERVQSTMIYTNGSTKTFISYNFRGAPYLGGVDMAQITGNGKKIRLRSELRFFNADVNAILATNNNIFASLSTDDQVVIDEGSRSAAMNMNVTGFTLRDNNIVLRAIPSFAATSIAYDDNRVYVTSGNTGGLTVLSSDLQTEIAYIDIPEARWVDVSDEYIVVLSGDHDGDNRGSLLVYNPSDLSFIGEYGFDGAYTPEAKNTVEIAGHLAFIAAGKGGTVVMDLTDGNILQTISIPNAASLGLSEDVVATNAVSVDDDKIFISNGEAGVYVAETNKNISSYRAGESLSISLIGQLRLRDLESVNHISYRNKLLLVAAGRGGTKTILLR